MQHAYETPCVIEVRNYRALGDLEAHLRGVHTRAVETLDDELQELQIAERLPRDVDGHPAIGGHLDRAAAQRGQGRLHDPTIDEAHEPIAFGRAHEFDRWYFVARLVLKAHEHFHRRPVTVVAVGRNDGLMIKLEAIFLERALQALQPLNLTGVPGKGLIARRVHGDAAGTLLLCDITRGIRRGQQFLQRTALA